MKVVCYINDLRDGGAQRAMSVLANGLAARGHQVSLVTEYVSATDYPLHSQVHRHVLEGEFSNRPQSGQISRNVKRIATLRKICKQQNADILISFMEDANLRGILATRFLKTKNLISTRIDPRILMKSKAKKIQLLCVNPLADGCVFQTEDAQSCLPVRLQKKSKIIFNPVSDSFYNIQGSPLKEKRIVSCGRLSKQKRFDLLINAFDKVCEDFPEYSLEIYGVGELQEQLQAQIASLHRADRIRLMGRCEDVPNTIKDASLFVLASDFEGLPNALMEAMALGLPVISTDCGGGGARALIQNGVDGRIVPCDDVAALSDAIREALSDLDTTKCRGEQAGIKAKNFSSDCVVAQWEAYIKQICEQ